MKRFVRTLADRLLESAVSRYPFELTCHEVPVYNLPEAFQGFTIAQISDLHVDRWNTPILEAAIDIVNGLNADLVVSTGDVIANGKDYLGDVTHLLKQLQARHGKMACLGNHDYSDGGGSYNVRAALQEADFEVLVNESTELTLQHQQIQLASADDLILGRQCLNNTNRRLVKETPTILLSHNPENFDAMAHFKPSLVLSGHTHGGQIHLPGGIHKRLMRSPYIAGLYECMASRLYVNRGLGSAVFVHHWKGSRISIPTPRLAVRPEISVFRLVNPKLIDRPPLTLIHPAKALAS